MREYSKIRNFVTYQITVLLTCQPHKYQKKDLGLTNPRKAAHVMAVMNFLISFESTREFVVRVARPFFSSNSIFIVELLLLCLGHQLSD